MSRIDPQRHSEQRSLILRTAARLMASEGYHGMSMRDLARATGKSLATFYNYYSSKEEILFHLQKEAFETLIATISDDLVRVGEPEEALYVFIVRHVRYFVANPDVMSVLIHEAASLPPEERRAIRVLKEGYFQLGLQVVRRLVEGGGETLDDGELERRTYSLFGMLNWIYGWYQPERYGTPQELAATIHRIAVGGLVATDSSPRLRHLEHHILSVETRPLLGGTS